MADERVIGDQGKDFGQRYVSLPNGLWIRRQKTSKIKKLPPKQRKELEKKSRSVHRMRECELPMRETVAHKINYHGGRKVLWILEKAPMCVIWSSGERVKLGRLYSEDKKAVLMLKDLEVAPERIFLACGIGLGTSSHDIDLISHLSEDGDSIVQPPQNTMVLDGNVRLKLDLRGGGREAPVSVIWVIISANLGVTVASRHALDPTPFISVLLITIRLNLELKKRILG
ncbi:hypothetical protein K435DRAFT_809694 [Dendrothele bispora CBS 962.96]|uniref:Uncharacterized protein n=1 Tax=Dendrothele bispora (strain CBS 962.96) TaxID=1314807 RepID=A0A4S8KXD8_DENBC|nr:hypothetical protein K435DRAFT_809694 [Dendrothele bispora CBS 962.96]